jgi:hypothetical protein
MANSTQSTPQLIGKGFSRMLIFTGAAVFLLGDRFLREIEHWSFFASEAAGILTGVALMLFGAGIDKAFKPPKTEKQSD